MLELALKYVDCIRDIAIDAMETSDEEVDPWDEEEGGFCFIYNQTHIAIELLQIMFPEKQYANFDEDIESVEKSVIHIASHFTKNEIDFMISLLECDRPELVILTNQSQHIVTNWCYNKLHFEF
jgi:hypothetical protein